MLFPVENNSGSLKKKFLKVKWLVPKMDFAVSEKRVIVSSK